MKQLLSFHQLTGTGISPRLLSVQIVADPEDVDKVAAAVRSYVRGMDSGTWEETD